MRWDIIYIWPSTFRITITFHIFVWYLLISSFIQIRKIYLVWYDHICIFFLLSNISIYILSSFSSSLLLSLGLVESTRLEYITLHKLHREGASWIVAFGAEILVKTLESSCHTELDQSKNIYKLLLVDNNFRWTSWWRKGILQKLEGCQRIVPKNMSYPNYSYRPNIPYHEPNTNLYNNGPTTQWSVDLRPSDFVAIPMVAFYLFIYYLFIIDIQDLLAKLDSDCSHWKPFGRQLSFDSVRVIPIWLSCAHTKEIRQNTFSFSNPAFRFHW